MQSDRYKSKQDAPCIWCGEPYNEGFSRAQSKDLFCTRRCEIEARFWLLDQFNSVIVFRRDSENSAEL
jgi:hypothetical protein